MNQLDELITQLQSEPEKIEFHDVINVIDKHYRYIPTRFINGPEESGVINEAGENEGSCKIFSFAKLHKLNVKQTLNCFGQYYRDDVLNHPERSDHQNIRAFMKYGWEQIVFEGTALTKKE